MPLYKLTVSGEITVSLFKIRSGIFTIIYCISINYFGLIFHLVSVDFGKILQLQIFIQKRVEQKAMVQYNMDIRINDKLYILLSEMRKVDENGVYGAVLLVCIYNKHGNILTHDYFYQLFNQYGEIVKILIFQKAKVWKTFIEFADQQSAGNAMKSLNNRVVFEDGSRLNIFSSKLKHIQFQNGNLGGVNYEKLRLEQQVQKDFKKQTRTRRNTYHQSITPMLSPQQITYERPLCKKDLSETQGTKDSFGLSCNNSSDSFSSFSSFSIDQQFLQLARQSEQFLELQRQSQLQQEKIRGKSKTLVTNPNNQLFIKQNNPSRVLFVRSVPSSFTNTSLCNIFSNFGSVNKLIYMKDKENALIQFQKIQEAIIAKDELNYSKSDMKVFYSHYQFISSKQDQFSGIYLVKKSNKNARKPKVINPPSQNLYIGLSHPLQQGQIREKCLEIGVQINRICWKKMPENRWSCLIDFRTINNSLLVMGLLQGSYLSNGKVIRFSFTKQKL